MERVDLSFIVSKPEVRFSLVNKANVGDKHFADV